MTEVVANNVESIGNNAFASSKLTAANFEKATKIGDRAFVTCNNLETVKLGGVTEMGKETFLSSLALKNVTFGNGTKVIGVSAFYASSARANLISVVIPDGNRANRRKRVLQLLRAYDNQPHRRKDDRRLCVLRLLFA